MSQLCLGCMNFGRSTGEAESIAIIHEALDAGINFIDTANVYAAGTSETFVGKALKGKRHQVVLATKVHNRMGPGPNDWGNSRLHIMQQVEASLKRLQTDHIDLYQLHRPDPDTPLEEQLGVLTDLVRQGKVRYIGTSCFPAWHLCESLWVSDRHHLEHFVSEQPRYNILVRAIEEEVLPFCLKYGIGIVSFGPVSGGWLTGKYRKGQPVPPDSRAVRNAWDLSSAEYEKLLAVIERLLPLAQEVGVTLGQFSVAWVLANPAVTSPIIGPRTPEQLREYLGALDVKLTEDVLRRVDEIAPPKTNLRR